ncbi:MAG: DUF115 domain-containing protein [Treponema sp.]|nr:DUF115 domain-containing protein [Treponema sp.]
MNIEFLQAKNGEKTFCIDKVFFHSSYAPSKEAERFVNTIQFPYKPQTIFIVEPGFSYTYDFFKQKFPESQIVCIRLLKDLEPQNEWDSTINFTQEIFETELLNNYDESKLLKSFMVTWTPTATLFKKENDFIWKTYKKCLDSAKTLLITRQYFEKKWLYNSCRFFSLLTNTYIIKQNNNFPIVITASGPSLKSALPVLQQQREKFFLISVSSSLSVLLANKITPDLVVTTDGGFWAAEHLKLLVNKYNNIPVAITSEAFVQPQILMNNPVIPLRYVDGISENFFIITKTSFITAQRNGTVSGTALNFAESITNGEIFLCGLDLSVSKGFQHSQPNELEKNNSIYDNRIKNKNSRTVRQEFSTAGLDIYLNWFCNQKYKNQTFRIIENNKNKINGIEDINGKQFESKLKKREKIDKNDVIQKSEKISPAKRHENCKKILEFIEKNQNSEEWKQQIFPIDYVSIYHAENINDKEKLLKNLDEKNQKLIERLRKILDV